MTRLEKCELLKEKGYTYNPETGKIYGVRGFELNSSDGEYLYVRMPNNTCLAQHHYAWFITYGNVDFEMLDHINRDKTDNRICNLRITNDILNMQNTNAKGYTFNKKRNKWQAQIGVDYRNISLGHFNTEEEARQAYLSAKLKYHSSFTHLNQ